MHWRKVIVLDYGGPTAEATDILRGADWITRIARTPDEAEELIVESGARVAVAIAGPKIVSAFDSRNLEDLLQRTPRVAWIACVEAAALENSWWSTLIAGYFRDYLTWPCQPEFFLHSVGHAHGMVTLAADIPDVPSDIHRPGRDMLARSDVMRGVIGTLRKCARSGAPIAITGESGTGKELAALEIHRNSPQHDGPFVAVNCGAIPENLIQAELFGHTKGAFTGADRDKKGRVESARGGTLFLDEIGDLSPRLQVNLLRFLQEGVIEKIGSTRPIHVDTRVVAATHKNLEKAVEQGEFREDLYYRLNVLRVELPPLRDRGEDIEFLAHAYLAYFSQLGGSRANAFSSQALSAMRRHDWPGNIRELVNRIRRAVVMAERCLLTPADLDLDRRSGSRVVKNLEQALAQAERDALCGSLSCSGNNISEAARSLGVSRPTVYRLMEKHGLHNRPRQLH